MATRAGKSGRSKAEREFVSEAEEILEAMREDLAGLSEDLARAEEPDPERVHALFRSAHSLKALAGMFQFERVEALAHALEDVLDRLRLGRVDSGSALLGLIDESVELFAGLLEQVGDAEAIAAGASRIDDLLARIRRAAEAPVQTENPEPALALDPALRRALTEYEEHRLHENLRRGRGIFVVQVGFALDAFEEGLTEVTARLKQNGELISTLPSAGGADAELCFSLLTASEASREALCQQLELPEERVQPVGGPTETEPAQDPQPAPALDPVSAEGSLRSISDSVRVDIRKLDELMNLIGELVVQRGAITDLIEKLEAQSETAHIGSEFSKLHKGLDRKLRELQSAVIDVRMVPLRQVFDKVLRVVRRMRSDLGKEVELEILGADTELDKLIVEGLVDPLMHLVRNAIDHGIEPPDERYAAGKDREGRIRIEALQRGNHVVIEVSDDGRGIDRESLLAKAVRQELITPNAGLSDRETLELIFAPGMSTRETVTESSGRGVGMDVVRANLGELGGVVEVDSTPGVGTRISMTLPITLAIIQSLVVGAGRQRFAIPLNSVLETLWMDEAAVQVSEGRQLMNLRGEPLLLRRLAEEFQLEREPDRSRSTVIVLGIGDQRLGLVVDRLEGQQDTVIKPIQGPLAQIRGIAGGTDLGDQHPVLVLDVSALIEDATRHREAA